MSDMGRAKKDRKFLVVWWAYQRPYYAVTPDEEQAAWTANLRNGLVVEFEGRASVAKVVDHWRRDADGNPIPADRREPAGEFTPIPARRARRSR